MNMNLKHVRDHFAEHCVARRWAQRVGYGERQCHDSDRPVFGECGRHTAIAVKLNIIGSTSFQSQSYYSDLSERERDDEQHAELRLDRHRNPIVPGHAHRHRRRPVRLRQPCPPLLRGRQAHRPAARALAVSGARPRCWRPCRCRRSPRSRAESPWPRTEGGERPSRRGKNFCPATRAIAARITVGTIMTPQYVAMAATCPAIGASQSLMIPIAAM